MGASESRQLSDDSAPKSGYHVVRVAANSPAHLAGIEPFFDFCVGLDGVALNVSAPGDDTAGGGAAAGMGAWKKLEEREGTEVTLNIWSSKRQQLRDVSLVPSRTWSASTSNSTSQPSLLGLTLRPCSPHLALSSVWHILDILESSPAESAGLVPFGDYIIGWSSGILRNEGDFYDLVEAHEGRPLRLYVYNADYDHTREVIIVPNREWGGEGLLGCGVGFGLLHRIPRPQDRPPVQETEDDQPSRAAVGLLPQTSSAGARGPPTAKSAPMSNLGSQRNGSGGAGNSQPRIEEEEEEDGEEGDDSHTSGVTISMRRDDDEEDE
ncbi:hypothetical protein BCV69DRAFT_267851 [Microstroma glucosiphilum]|uniref:PDZ GRASP-type domain-containing protein n=1 Tax=Pseudomicrostroma glucosiphilum TaxID=1684307 RepID=A0A316UB55_9BASI|nr:hypothetical protein BCV69DRAFT_267851 [Pseudomicrostroma glucosiphilum]PWN22460.1 hypothetical protein BCV69DRAFT_267851 [Pseudomicrostroma glucosiphilum]